MSSLPSAAAVAQVGSRGVQVLDHIALKAWDRVLFVECGDGWIAEEAWRRAGRAYVFGLDMSPEHVSLAKRLREVPGKLEFGTWDGQSLPIPAFAFDRAVAILDVPQALAVLVRELGRVLRSDGCAYLLHHQAADTVRDAFAKAGWTDVHEVARFDDAAILVCAAQIRGAPGPADSGPVTG